MTDQELDAYIKQVALEFATNMRREIKATAAKLNRALETIEDPEKFAEALTRVHAEIQSVMREVNPTSAAAVRLINREAPGVH